MGGVVRTMPPFVDVIVVVDDASRDETSAVVQAVGDPRVDLVVHAENQGVGGSLIDAHLRAIHAEADISVVMGGDGQMDPAYLPALLDPIVEEHVDFTKGNRFFDVGTWQGMPRHRVFGNIVLTFLTKTATGYWNLVDPQNGYTAMGRRVQRLIDWSRVARDYSFENDVLAELGLLRARIRDIDIPALYGEEVSGIKLRAVVPSLLRTLIRASMRRFWLSYMLRSFSPVALFVLTGVPMLLWAIVYGVWVVWATRGPAVATTGTVMLAVLPFLLGFQLILAAFVIDIVNTPK